MRHIPNILSAIRLLMVGVFIYFFVNDEVLAALITYIVAFATDIVDGYLARRNNWISNIGKVLDPGQLFLGAWGRTSACWPGAPLPSSHSSAAGYLQTHFIDEETKASEPPGALSWSLSSLWK